MLARDSLSKESNFLYRVLGKCGIPGLANFSKAKMTSYREAWLFGWVCWLVGTEECLLEWFSSWLADLQKWEVTVIDCLAKANPWFWFLGFLMTSYRGYRKISLCVGTLILDIKYMYYLHKASVYLIVLRYNLE